ncbi:MAG: EthD domain-containing protein [Myxococcales bacterium]|nr:EthD domain-containing protein [Myxococcales bacterium]
MAGYRLDPLRWASTAPVHDVTIELRCGPQPVEPWRALQPLADRLFAHADASKSSVLVGQDYVFRACPPQPVRFQYLMRRRADLTHEAYAKHYSEVHSRFGYKTRGVEGYAQFHVDPAASSRAARLLGLDTIEVDGVSQLYLRSLGRFLLATPINATIGAGRDERNFVGASAMLTSRVIASAGPAAEALR